MCACRLCQVADPFVEGIGNIEYNDVSQSLVVSGYTEYDHVTPPRRALLTPYR